MRAKRATPIRRAHAVAVLAYDGLGMFGFAIACEIFGTAYRPDGNSPWYDLIICAERPGPVRLEGGLVLHVPHGLDALAHADTVIVPSCESPDGPPPGVVHALRQAHDRGARLVSLCTGAMVLAAAGLLDGRRATTHWSDCPELARRYPRVQVDPSVLYIDDGDILTSAGNAASIDLCLHLVRRDHGTDVATRLARQLVVPPHRDGGQAQYIDAPVPQLQDGDLFADTMAWMQEHLAEQITITDLARRSAMSRRTFARRFASTTGTTPYQWLLRQRLQLAQRLLETSELPIDLVAAKSGFVTGANLRKHFGRVVRTNPQAYRHTFSSRPDRPSATTALAG